MAYLYLACIVACAVSIHAGNHNTTVPKLPTPPPPSVPGPWYGTTEQNGIKLCVFPFTYQSIEYHTCTMAKSPVAWCATVDNYRDGDEFGNCTRTSNPFTADAAAATCYVYTKLNDTLSYHGELYVQLKNYTTCQTQCNTFLTCVGINFDRLQNRCYLGMNESFNIPYPGPGVDHYTRSPCSTTTVNTPSTTASLCNDTFTMQNDTLAYGGIRFSSGTTVELCTQECVSFTNRTAVDYCLGFDFNDNVGGNKCYLHTNRDEFAMTGTMENIYHFTRHACVPLGTCGDKYNRTANQFAYGGVNDVAMTVDDCKLACTADTTCIAFDYSTKNSSTIRCFLHLNAYTAIPNSQDVDQYIRYKPTCVATTTTPMVPTTIPDGTTRPVVTTPCTDYFSRVNDTLSSGGIIMLNMNTIEACTSACLALPNCGLFDFDRTTSACYSHDYSTQRVSHKATDVDQFTREKCIASTTTSTTTVKPTSPTSNPGTTFGCQYNFTEKLNHHAFGGSQSSPNQPTSPLCQQACVNAGSSCGGFDFNTVDNTCWLIPEANADQIRSATGINNYRKHETCPSSPPTTPKPCVPTFEVTVDHHGFGGSIANGMDTAEKCKSACFDNVKCVAVDYNRISTSCWMHINIDDVTPLVPITGIDSYKITDRCDNTPTKVPTSGPNTGTTTIATTPTTTTVTTVSPSASPTFSTSTPTTTTPTTTTPTTTIPTTTTPTTTTPSLPEDCVADIAFVIDSSGSIRDQNPVDGSYDNYDVMLAFINSIVNRMQVGPGYSRFAAVTFSNLAQVRINLNDYTTKATLTNAISNLKYSGGSTNTTGGLRITRQNVFTNKDPDRPGVKNIILLLTDGASTIETSGIYGEAQTIRNSGTTIFGIGVAGVNKTELASLVTQPSSKYYFYVSDFTNLSSVFEKLVLGTCATVANNY